MKKTLFKIIRTPLVWLVAAISLYLLSILFLNDVFKSNDLKAETGKLQKYLDNQVNYFDKLIADTSLLKNFSDHQESKEEFNKSLKIPFGFYLAERNSLGSWEMLFWNNQVAVPEESHFAKPDGYYFEKLENGYYLSIRKSVFFNSGKDPIIAIGLIPVLYDYYAETDYLPNNFAHSKTASSKIELSKEYSPYSVKDRKGYSFFYLKEKTSPTISGQPVAVLVLRFSATIFILLFLYFLSEYVAQQKGILQGIGILIAGLVLLRFISYFTSFPLNLRQFELFDPSVYGANAVQKSLGDLFINAVFFCWITFFAWNKIKEPEKILEYFPRLKNKRGISILFLIIIVSLTFVIAETVRSLAADSNISFDVIDFFSLTRFSIIGFAVLAILVIGFYFSVRLLLLFVTPFFSENSYLTYLIIAVAGLTYLTFNINSPLLAFYIFVLVWLMLYIKVQCFRIFNNNSGKPGMSVALFWIFFFSVFITPVIIDANREKEWEQRKKMAHNIDMQSDPYNERQLSISFTYLDDEFLSNNFARFKDQEINQELRDSIMRKAGFLSKYDLRLYIFDAESKALFNDDTKSLNTLNTIIEFQAKPTNTPNLYFYETSFEKFTFIFKRDARDTAKNLLGYFFIISNPERFSSDALYLELFRRGNENSPEKSNVYSFASYRKGILTTGTSNKYSFATALMPSDFPGSQYENRINNKFDELWFKASNDKVIVIAKMKDSFIEAITLFSYIFCSFLFLVVLFNLVGAVFKVRDNYKILARLLQWSIRTQIHNTIIFISIFSFVIIGIATISFFNKRYKQNNSEKLSRTMQITVKEMEKKLEKHMVFDDQLAIYDSVSNYEVLSLVNEVAEVHNVDVNIYDTSGNLQVTSQPLIYKKGFLSNKIHPQAYYNLKRNRQVQYIQQENLGSINYMSIYAPIRDAGGHAFAYLNIPYFLSQQELKQEISFFLVTVINLNAFIFLIAGVIALFITNRVTRSFFVISEKMKEVNLGKTNEIIDWKRDDEIGELVKEYNKMVNKLEVSADALAKSEREGAWREMARQVAHEIKNPLTPMKLSIQYLQKSIDNNSGDIKELTSNVAKTLVEQIDHLSKIAFDFSQFANIGNTNPEVFNLNDTLYSLRDLYHMNENVEVNLIDLTDKNILYTDKTQMNRLFTNLFQNAMEACKGKEACKIEVQVVSAEENVIVSVKDNGEGIPTEMQARIFAPNFTTKSSGTGLGLAMCKGIVEKAKGKIWFETSKGVGTTFFVELPLAVQV